MNSVPTNRPANPAARPERRLRPVLALLALTAGLLLAWFGLLSLTLAPARPLAAAGPAQETPPTTQAPGGDIIVDGEVAHPRLTVAGRVVFDAPGYHLGRPQLSPDGRLVAVSVVPAGAETDRLARVLLFRREDGQLLDSLPGYLPRWDERGQRLFLERRAGGQVQEVAVELETGQATVLSTRLAQPPARPLAASQAITYPATIRVAHHPANTCRDLPAYQVEEIPFEEYVARSVPAEVPSSWPFHALAAQAIAARTYAWYQIRQGRESYDVTDWANFQMMCDDRYPSTDAAVAATAGQYLSAQSDGEHAPIIAMYSAINGHPTRTNPDVDYLQAVPDPYSLGETPWGHGYGLSQWGGQRRALDGHTYRQILGHYYSRVHLQSALTPTLPVAGLLGMVPGGFAPRGGFRWRTLAPYTAMTSTLVIRSDQGLTRTELVTITQTVTHTTVVTDSNGITDTVVVTETSLVTETQLVTGPLTLQGRGGVWQHPLALAEGAQVVASLWLSDTLQEEITLTVDSTPPGAPSLTLPETVEVHTATVTVGSPASTTLGLSNGWLWQGEALVHDPGSGAAISDPAAENGQSWEAQAGVHSPGLWYGPYAKNFPAEASYRAIFRLRAGVTPAQHPGDLWPDTPIARLEVTDQAGTQLLGLRDVWPSDFVTSTEYAAIPVDFHLFEPPEGVEFRVRWYGTMDLALDSVRVWQIREGGVTESFAWPLATGMKSPSVQAVAFDAAGNASPVISRTTTVVDDAPPTIHQVAVPEGWQTGEVITVSATVQDFGSGLDVTRGSILLDGQEQAASFSHPEDPWQSQTLQAVLTGLADGEHTLRFRVADKAGYVQESAVYTVAVDASPPSVTATTSLTGPSGWVSQTVTVTLSGEDATSGMAGIAYVLDDAPFVMYRAPFSLTQEGLHTIRYWAQDQAGNFSFSQWAYVGIDYSPPQVGLSLYPISPERARVVWSGEDPLSGVVAYELEVQRDGGEWSALASASEGQANSLELDFLGAEELSVRVRGVDRVGHWSAWQEASTTPVDNWLYLPLVTR